MTERRDRERRRNERTGEEPRGPERRRGERRARASAGFVLAAAALTASAAPGRAIDVPAVHAPKSSRIAAIRAERLVMAGLLRPSLNSEFDVHIEDAAARHGVSRELIRAIIQVESGFDRSAVSAAGARGLMQLMPVTARRFGVVNRFDARQNIFGGTRYLRALLDQYRGDVSLTAAAYNAGENCVARYNGIPPYKETQDYVRKVTALLGTARELAAGGEFLEERPTGKG
jgi:soluble lytic murein transglycosylase-like protein